MASSTLRNRRGWPVGRNIKQAPRSLRHHHRPAAVSFDWTHNYVYGKLGYQADWFEFGTTAFSVDACRGMALHAAGDNSIFCGIQTVNDGQTTFCPGIREHRYDAPQESCHDTVAVIAGAAVKF